MLQLRRPGNGFHAARGAALVEFALTSLVLYLVLAGTVEFGRLVIASNALQDVARVAARELAVAPLSATVRFDDALACDPAVDNGCLVDLRRRVFDPSCLVIDLSDPAVAPDPDGYFAALPVVNRMLRTLMVTEPERPTLLRYPGALLGDASAAACSAVGPAGQAGPTGLTVGIPMVVGRHGDGAETITWLPVVQEIRAGQDAECPERGPFSLLYLGTRDECGDLGADPVPSRGLAAVRVNYPYQAAMLSGFQPAAPTATDPLPPNLSRPLIADDASVESTNAPPGNPIGGTAIGPYAGPYGLGAQYALAGGTVRPFRRLVSAQAVFRREVFQ